MPDPLYGVTFDTITPRTTAQIVDATRHLARRPTSRIVFDPGTTASDYASPIRRIRRTSYVLGELLDSSAMRSTSLAGFHRRVSSFERTLGTDVDIWEIGNELNGEWLGPTAATVAKLADAFDQTSARGYRTAMTLVYNPSCWSRPENEMFRWAGANVPARIKAGVGYVLVSYYEQDCNGHSPQLAEWQSVFDRLHAMFPTAKLGFGEVGTHPDSPLAYKAATLRRYYGLRVTTPGFVGGSFWWYGAQDLLPWRRAPLWRVLNAELQTY